MFRRQGNFIVNEKGKVLDVHGGADAENRNIIVWTKHGKINQQWDIVYADEWPEPPKKGELNPDFGMYVERHFYIISQLPSHRHLDVIGNKLAIKTPAQDVDVKKQESKIGRRTQVWYFDQNSLTIRSWSNN